MRGPANRSSPGIFLVSASQQSRRIAFGRQFIQVKPKHSVGIRVCLFGSLLGTPETKQERAKKTTNDETAHQRQAGSFYYGDKNSQSSLSKFACGSFVNERVLAEPL